LPHGFHAIKKLATFQSAFGKWAQEARFFFVKMKDRYQRITRGVADLVEPILEGMGFELVDIEYVSQQGRWVLRLFIDKEGGVTIDDCASVSGELGDLIDVRNFIDHPYVLEVSSPGLDRPIRKEKDILKVIGKRIKVKMATPVKGRRNYTGSLRDFKEGMLHMDVDGEPVSLDWRQVDKASLVYEFNP
jgi:ribosome maturation factor RimP